MQFTATCLYVDWGIMVHPECSDEALGAVCVCDRDARWITIITGKPFTRQLGLASNDRPLLIWTVFCFVINHTAQCCALFTHHSTCLLHILNENELKWQTQKAWNELSCYCTIQTCTCSIWHLSRLVLSSGRILFKTWMFKNTLSCHDIVQSLFCQRF